MSCFSSRAYNVIKIELHFKTGSMLNMNKLMSKVGFMLAGTALGGVAGAEIANQLVEAFYIAEESGNLLEVGLSGAGGLAGGWAGELIEKATWSESPPNNPKHGDSWYNTKTKELFACDNPVNGWFKVNLPKT